MDAANVIDEQTITPKGSHAEGERAAVRTTESVAVYGMTVKRPTADRPRRVPTVRVRSCACSIVVTTPARIHP